MLKDRFGFLGSGYDGVLELGQLLNSLMERAKVLQIRVIPVETSTQTPYIRSLEYFSTPGCYCLTLQYFEVTSY